MDEPTASLDVRNSRRVIDTLAALQHEYGITIVLIEHRLAEAAQLAKRVILMEDGHIYADGSPQEVFANCELQVRPGLRRPTEEPSVSWDRLIRSNGNQTPEASPLLIMEGISAGFNGQAVIHDIHLESYAELRIDDYKNIVRWIQHEEIEFRLV